MKTTKILSTLTLALLLSAAPAVLFGQTRIAVPGSAGRAHMVTDNNQDIGLEINGTLVVPKTYASFQTSDGIFFAVTAKDGKMGICNDHGDFLFPCTYAKTSVSGKFLSVYQTVNGTPKFYAKDAPTVEIKAQRDNLNQRMDEIAARVPGGFDPVRVKQKKATELAQTFSDSIGYDKAFRIEDDWNGKQDLIVDGKVLINATTFVFLNDLANFRKSNCWFFLVVNEKNGISSYGVYALSIYYKDDERIVEHLFTIPYGKYSFLMKSSKWVPGVTSSGNELSVYGKRLDANGKPIENQ